MAVKVTPEGLGGAIEKELTLYSKEVMTKVDQATAKAIKRLVDLTKATAPVDRGVFKSSITSKKVESGVNGNVYAWYVGGAGSRLTHLIVNGHATKNGGRVPGNPFLINALGTVLPEYEKAIKEAISK